MRPCTHLLAICLALAACEADRRPGADAGDDATASQRSTAGATVAPTAPEPWPALPRDGAALDSLIEQQTLRVAGELPPLTVERIVAGVRDGVRRSSLAAGWRPIAAELSKHAAGDGVYWLFGGFHDAPGQLDAFRRLVGPLGITPAPLTALEQLQADGAWAGVDESQIGDDRLLGRYLDRGDAAALAALEETQRGRDYTAWKYDYVERVTDVISAVRAAGGHLVGCDMPSILQARVKSTLGERGLLLRDLHCALALRRALSRSAAPRAAIFIGDAHLSPGRLARFLPRDATILRVHLVGMRASEGGIEGSIAGRLSITEPLLVPIDHGRFVLLLPDARLAAVVDRVRSSHRIEAGDRQQVVVEGFSGSADIGDQHAEVDGTTRLPAGPGRVHFVLGDAHHAVAGAVDMPEGGSIRLTREPDGTLHMHTRVPAQ